MSVYATYGLGVRVVYLLVALLWAPVGVVLRRCGARQRHGGAVLPRDCRPAAKAFRLADGPAWPTARSTPANCRAGVQPGALAPRASASPSTTPSPTSCATPCRSCSSWRSPRLIFAVPGNLAMTRRAGPCRRAIPRPSEPTCPRRRSREAQSLLCRFGSHTLTHPDLTSLSPAHLREQLRPVARAAAADPRAADVEDLALPFGACNSRVLAAAREAGYRRIFTLEPCLQPLARGSHRTLLDDARTPGGCEFRLTCAGAYAWLRPWRRLLRRLRQPAVDQARERSPHWCEYSYRLSRIGDGWQQAAAGFADYSYRQVWDFGAGLRRAARRLQRARGRCATPRACSGLADVRIKRLPLLGSGIAYINGGPLVRRTGHREPRPAAVLPAGLAARSTSSDGAWSCGSSRRLGEPDWNAAQQEVFGDLGFAAAPDWPSYRTLLVSHRAAARADPQGASSRSGATA